MAEVNEYNSASVDPSKSPDIDFELYSVPAYETGMPEFVKGKDISSSKRWLQEMTYFYVRLILILIGLGLFLITKRIYHVWHLQNG